MSRYSGPFFFCFECLFTIGKLQKTHSLKKCHLMFLNLKPNLIHRGVLVDCQYVVIFVIAALKLNLNSTVLSLDLSCHRPYWFS